MLLEFSVTNFRSIKEKQTLSLLKSKKDELEGNFTTITLSTGKTIDVLNSAVIYGANASGKSNLVIALTIMLDMVRDSFDYKQNEDIPNIDSFAFGSSEVVEFEIDFVNQHGIRFVYGFSTTSKKIIDEWLFQYPKGKPQNLIDRESTHNWGAMNALSGKKKLWQESTKDVSLFLSTASQLNGDFLSTVVQNLTQIRGVMGDFHPSLTVQKIEENDQKQEVLSFLKNADISIVDIHIEHDKKMLDDITLEQKLLVESLGIDKQQSIPVFRIGMIHDNGVKFYFEQESDGTQKLFSLIGAWLDVLENGHTLILDELQNSLHPKLVEYLVKMFHNPKLNKKGAQLVFVTHETSLLDQEIFRRDQVWFCEKENNATQVFSLADFKVRKGVTDIEKSYLAGRYGAVPFLR
jgi:AAA15 family ATPase/GTPase